MLDCVSGFYALPIRILKLKYLRTKQITLIEMIPVSKGIKDFF